MAQSHGVGAPDCDAPGSYLASGQIKKSLTSERRLGPRGPKR